MLQKVEAVEKPELDSANAKLQQVRETITPEISQLPFELLDRRTNKSVKLVANSGQVNPVDGLNRWFDYEFSEPFF